MRGLQAKTVFVTGGGGAIGRAICARLAQAGAVVGACDRDAAAAERTASGIVAAGGKAHAAQADISRYDEVKRALTGFEAAAGPLELLVNCAGWDRCLPFVETEPALWDALIDVNLKGHLNVLHVALRGMKERGRGRVVTISSD